MKERARLLMQDMTLAENRMWYFLRNRRLKGDKFVREYVIESVPSENAQIRRCAPPSPPGEKGLHVI